MPRLGAFGAALGLIAVVLGTFLSWTRSGEVYRDSYESLGIIKQLGFMKAFPALQTFLDIWLAVIPAVGVCIAMYALGLRRSAAGLAVILAVMMGTIAGAASVQAGGTDGIVGIAVSGPTVTLVGAVLALSGAVVVLATQRRTRAQQDVTGGEP